MGSPGPRSFTTVRPARTASSTAETLNSSASTSVVGEPMPLCIRVASRPERWSSLPPMAAAWMPCEHTQSQKAMAGSSNRTPPSSQPPVPTSTASTPPAGSGVLPRAADAQVSQIEHRVVDGEERALLAERPRRRVEGAPVVADAGVHLLGGADAIGVARVGGKLHAGKEQQLRVPRLRRPDQAQVRGGVVIREVGRSRGPAPVRRWPARPATAARRRSRGSGRGSRPRTSGGPSGARRRAGRGDARTAAPGWRPSAG